MAYLLDSDILIRGKRDHYRFKVCPGFWDWIVEANKNGRVYSIEQVQRELQVRNDELANWVATQSSALFLPPTPDVVQALGTVSAWATQQSYEQQAIDEFFKAADFWLVGYALAKGWKVVTHEVSAPLSKKKIKLPDACIGVGAQYTNPFQMLDDEGARFVF